MLKLLNLILFAIGCQLFASAHALPKCQLNLEEQYRFTERDYFSAPINHKSINPVNGRLVFAKSGGVPRFTFESFRQDQSTGAWSLQPQDTVFYPDYRSFPAADDIPSLPYYSVAQQILCRPLFDGVGPYLYIQTPLGTQMTLPVEI